jgi:epoxyqueuosine reductase
MTPTALAGRVKAVARAQGFDRVAIGPAGPPERGAAFAAWLDAGYAGTMGYLEQGRARRLDPGRVLPGARAVVACALNYHQGKAGEGPAHLARYAWGRDYHEVMAPRLAAVVDAITTGAPGSTGRAYVDTGPVLERELAARAGLGWVGKNTLLLHPALGSYFFIGVVLTTAELALDPPLPDRCGTCTRCLEACPTGAFVAPYVLDARRCIAYLTIEHRGPIPEPLREAVGSLAFGCDICQDVCPWNRHVPATGETAFRAEDPISLVEMLALDQAAYRTRLRGRPLTRARRAGLARNAAVALGNQKDSAAIPALATAMVDPDDTVREHAAWALGRLAAEEADGMDIDPRRDALVVVDLQNDFCPGGALGVRAGDEVVPVCNRLIRRFRALGGAVLLTRDWHPARTRHFQVDGGLWPPHCVQGTPGAEFHPDLEVPGEAIVVSKGTRPDEDAYSGFQGADAQGRTLASVLAVLGVRRLVLGGLATDYCVKATALDAAAAGFSVVVVADAVRAVDLAPGDGTRALEAMQAAGVRIVPVSALEASSGGERSLC